jgi:hypothetical protein
VPAEIDELAVLELQVHRRAVKQINGVDAGADVDLVERRPVVSQDDQVVFPADVDDVAVPERHLAHFAPQPHC